MKRKIVPSFACLLLLAAAPCCIGAERIESELSKATSDPALQSLSDEVERSIKNLRLLGHPPPYFVSYHLNGAERFEVSASLGAITDKSRSKWRNLDPTVLSGDYSFDSSKFEGESGWSTFKGLEQAVIDDDYDALRRLAWLLTDKMYKDSIEKLEEKKAFFRRNNVKDKLDDLTRESPEVLLEPDASIAVDENAWSDRVKRLSRIFRSYPQIQASRVNLEVDLITRVFVNSEGTKIKDNKEEWMLTISASTQAADGERIKDFEVVGGHKESDMPSYEELERRAVALADRITQLKDAPLIDDYDGPVLFEGQAAAEFFEQILADNLAAEHKTISANSNVIFAGSEPTSLQAKIGRRILPRSITVVDDPYARDFMGVPLLGGYSHDNEGVKARRVILVARGVLKALCTDRTPTKYSQHSNGHSNGYSGSTSVIFVTSDAMKSREELMQKLKEMGKEAELPYVLIARRLLDPNASAMLVMPGTRESFGSTEKALINLERPVMLYRLWLDTGKEELVRGAKFAPTTIRILRDIEATGDSLQAHLIGRGPDSFTHLICPSIIVKSVEIDQDKQETGRVPALPNPLYDVEPGPSKAGL
ncbi:MAG TPA: metallopeptidase TldD-related protein [Candidatus Obscuribacterales bacterium]